MSKAKFSDTFGFSFANQCSQCSHLDPNDPTVCAAFPGGIPDDILTDLFDHRNRHPGQTTRLLFKARKKTPAEKIMEEL